MAAADTKGPDPSDIDQLCINTIRTLSMDAIQKANSGHPGTPMALAPLTYTLWQRYLRFDPADPIWPNRDRFVLSAGHASMLLYSMLFLAGVKAVDPDYEVVGEPAVSLDDIKNFRQLDSKCPGHPEYRWTSGVETTTGPLGQGIATSVGMAVAGQWQAAHFNRKGAELFDFDVYAIAGDGCLMEGVSNEAASFAGHQKLANLCWVYDNNHITIDGHTSITYEDDVQARFEGYQWNVTRVEDANDLDMIARGFDNFKAEGDRPTLIIVDSHIGYGSPHKQDTAEAHGEPLGDEEVRETKKFYGWPEDAEFLVPDGVVEHFAEGIGKRGAESNAEWEKTFEAYAKDDPEAAGHLEAMQRRELPDGWDADIPSFEPDEKGTATRKASNKVENAVAAKVPWLLPGAADLTGSNSVGLEGAKAFEPENRDGRQFHYGIREHESAAISNGLSLSKLRPLWSTYLTFSDYARPAIRLSAADGTACYSSFHPRLDRFGRGRPHPPADRADRLAAGDPGPRRDPALRRQRDRRGLARGDGPPPPAGGVGADAPGRADPGPRQVRLRRWPSPRRLRARGFRGDPDVILIATGSEVSLAVEAHESLVADGVASRVVSLPCWELFDRQDDAYKDEVLPPAVAARVSIEEASTLGWDRWVGPEGKKIGMNTFGSSAPLKDLQTKFGFTPDKIAEAAKEVMK